MFAAKKQSVLQVTALIFAALSAFTTADGIQIILGNGSAALTIFSWLFAVATSLLMIYLILELPSFIEKGKATIILISYLAIAVMSIFFNFHSFFNYLSGSSTEAEQLRALRDRTSFLSSYAQQAIAVDLGIPKLQEQVARKKAEGVTEEQYYNRPGRGARYQKIVSELRILEARLDVAQRTFDEATADIKRLNQDTLGETDKALQTQRDADILRSIERARANYERIYSLALPHAPELARRTDLQISVIAPERAHKPEQSLKALISLFGGPTTPLSEWQRFAVFLALGLAIILDLPIFLTLFVLNLSMRSPQSVGKPHLPTSDSTSRKVDTENQKIPAPQAKNPFIEF